MKNKIISSDQEFTLDNLPCGALVTNADHIILDVNDYFINELCWNKSHLVGRNVESILTKASKVFYQSYLIPTLLHEKHCEEMQLSILNGIGNRIPITVNVKVNVNKNVYWVFFDASNRNKLYEELIQAREKLERQTLELKELAFMDELTGLLNRREMKSRSVPMLSQFARTKNALSVLMIDIDFFKRINDKHGHAEGDRVLRKFGRLLKECGRTSDLIARYGGEEFLIVLPDSNLEQTMIFSKRLHGSVNKVLIGDEALTVSIGVSLFDGKMSFEEVVDNADIALYEAKSLGRNRTEVFSLT
jgi:diguanylate cyclase (GGDEF)-like protein